MVHGSAPLVSAALPSLHFSRTVRMRQQQTATGASLWQTVGGTGQHGAQPCHQLQRRRSNLSVIIVTVGARRLVRRQRSHDFLEDGVVVCFRRSAWYVRVKVYPGFMPDTASLRYTRAGPYAILVPTPQRNPKRARGCEVRYMSSPSAQNADGTDRCHAHYPPHCDAFAQTRPDQWTRLLTQAKAWAFGLGAYARQMRFRGRGTHDARLADPSAALIPQQSFRMHGRVVHGAFPGRIQETLDNQETADSQEAANSLETTDSHDLAAVPSLATAASLTATTWQLPASASAAAWLAPCPA
eukprot:359927-Chlamydomonas_euryale.AAC.11